MRGKGRHGAASAEAQVDILSPKTCTRCACVFLICWCPRKLDVGTAFVAGRRRRHLCGARRRATGAMTLRSHLRRARLFDCNTECFTIKLDESAVLGGGAAD